MKPERVKYKYWLKYNVLFFIEHWLGYKLFLRFFGKSKHRLDQKIISEIGERDEVEIGELQRLDKLVSPEELEGLNFDLSQPLLIKGGAKNWDCVKKWDFDFFKSEYGDYEVILNDNKGLVFPKGGQQFESISLSNQIDGIRKGSKKYLKFCRVVDKHPELKEDLNLEWIRGFRKTQSSSFREETYTFFAPKGSITPVHCGLSSNVFVQIEGNKKWFLWAPEDRIFLDCRTDRTFYYYSEANPYDIKDEKFPLVKYAKRYEILLEPGDILCVPPFFWHQIENPTESIGLAYRYSSIKDALHASKMLTALMFLATKPSMLTHFLTTTFRKQVYIYTKKSEK